MKPIWSCCPKCGNENIPFVVGKYRIEKTSFKKEKVTDFIPKIKKENKTETNSTNDELVEIIYDMG